MTQNGDTRPEDSRPGVENTVPPTYDAMQRRIHWHHVLVRRRRWSKELDQVVGRLS